MFCRGNFERIGTSRFGEIVPCLLGTKTQLGQERFFSLFSFSFSKVLQLIYPSMSSFNRPLPLEVHDLRALCVITSFHVGNSHEQADKKLLLMCRNILLVRKKGIAIRCSIIFQTENTNHTSTTLCLILQIVGSKCCVPSAESLMNWQLTLKPPEKWF